MYIRESSESTLPNLPQSNGPQTSWDPSTISNIVFGIIMVFVGIVAIWQGRHRQVVALDGTEWSDRVYRIAIANQGQEELAIIRPLRRSTSSLSRPYIEPGAAIQLPSRYPMLHDTPTASSSVAQLAIANGTSLPDADHNTIIPTISNRVTTLSTMENAENISDLALELDITEVEGCEHSMETVGRQGTNSEVMT